MTKITFKNTFTLFHKKKFEKIIPSNFLEEKNLNQNSSWFKSIEPIINAKKNSQKLYEIQDFLLSEVDKKLFKEKLFTKLKKDFDNKKELIRENFLKTSDGSLCVGQNVILIDSLLKVIFKNIYLSIFNDDSYSFSMVAVGGYGRGELAPYSDLDLLFLSPDFLNKSDNQKIENVVQSILYFLWDLGFTVGHSTRSIQDCIQKSSEDLTISTSLLEKRLIIGNQEAFDALNDNFKSLINSTRTLDFVHAKL